MHGPKNKIELIEVCNLILQHFQVLELTIILARTPVAFIWEIVLKRHFQKHPISANIQQKSQLDQKF
jgi:hypothetical protein